MSTSIDTSSSLWIAAAERVRAVASEGTPTVVIERVIEAEYERDLAMAVHELRQTVEGTRP